MIKKNTWKIIGIFLIVLFIAIIFFSNENKTEKKKIEDSTSNFTIIVLPDTQKYSQSYPHIFTNQTKWIAKKKNDMNIVFVTHEGDIVQNHNSDIEWQNANNSISILDNKVPYGLLPGNHDMPTTLYNKYFPPSRYKEYTWYKGNYKGNNNNYQLFSAGGDNYIILHLEFCPSSDVIKWANKILKNYSDRKAIINTHGYINQNAQRTVHGCSDTNYIWGSLIIANDNIFLVLCGHIDTESRRTDTVKGREIHQLLANYQNNENGGNGWLRIMQFLPSEDKIHVQTYSPYLDKYETDANSEFTLSFDMTGSN